MNSSFDLSVVEDSLNQVAWSVSSATTTEITLSKILGLVSYQKMDMFIKHTVSYAI